jgi:hypothetical protein
MPADFSWSFTGAAADLTPPTVTSSTPADGSSGFPNNAPLTVVFSEPLLGFTLAGAVQLNTVSGPVIGSVAFDLVADAAVFTPTVPLAFGTEHTLSVAAGVEDLAGNGMASPFSATFVSNSRPAAPQLLSPVTGATGVSSPVTLEWSRPVDEDGDPLQFRVSVCNNASFVGAGPDCQQDIPVLASASREIDIRYAGIGMMGSALGLLGIVFVGGRNRRRLVLPALPVIVGMFLSSCSSGGGGSGGGVIVIDDAQQGDTVSIQVAGLSSGITFFWKVEADDGKGGTTISNVSTFTTQ